MSLEKIFNPKTIAVIGASSRKNSVGSSLVENLLVSGYEGIVYPINPKHKSIHGVKAYQNVKETPDRIDLAIICTPAKTVPGVVEECGQAGVGGVVIISAGFKEAGDEGKAMYQQMRDSVKKYGMRIIGPNCLGFIKPSLNINASFANKMALQGNIAFISQSGALCTAILDWANEQNVGFSHFVSIGSMMDVGFHDLIDYFGNDPNTSSILIYMESLSNARKFLSAARAFARTKPIIVLKVGKSSEGAKAAMSHTGSLTGNDMVYDAAFKRAGVIRAGTVSELFDCAQTLAMQPRPKGDKLAVITNAGGPGVIATDALIEEGGELATFSDQTMQRLDDALPAHWSRGNPIDVLGDAGPERYSKALELCLKERTVDGVLVILTPQSMTDPAAIAEAIKDVPNPDNKTILASWMGDGDTEEGTKILENARIPVYTAPENAVRCFMMMCSYSKNLQSLTETPSTIPHAFKPNTELNRALINGVISEGRNVLLESEAKELLKNYEIPVTSYAIAHDRDEAARLAEQVGFPVAMKVLSPDILHKTDVGGVQIGVGDSDAARKAFDDIMWLTREKRPDADIRGVFIENLVHKKHELLIGCKKDPLFGPVIVFGMGGVAVEVFKDTNVGLPPLNMALSLRLIKGTKIYKLLKGYRGMPGVDILSIQFLLYKFAYLVADFPEIQEIDINPFAVDENGGMVLDSKVILDKDVMGKGVKPYSHLVISPYPKEYVTEFTLKDGRKATLRPIKPEDEPMEAEMFRNFSEQTQRFRFFHLIKDISHDLLIRYTQIDYDREIAIIAEVDDNGTPRMAGVVRLIAGSDSSDAEFAIVVADPWQNQGLGNKFTDFILDIAKKRGIRKVYANVLKDNQIMLHIFRQRGFTITDEGDSCRCELNL